MKTAVAIALCATAALPAQESPTTIPERTSHARTSTNAEVAAFLDSLRSLPHAERIDRREFGQTVRNRPLVCALASLEPKRRPDELREGTRMRALILANIHGGEVEGKESVQALLREIALGEHEDILRHFDILFVPVFNADGNDAIDAKNRTSQNGPNAVGRRHNEQDLDLNRDYLKAETPEVRAQLGLFREFDPHLYMDLHTTNGSDHGYQLTYAPSLSVNLDPEIDAFTHDEFMPRVRAAMTKQGFRTFDYGNFGGGPRGRRGDPGWYTYQHFPRLGWNYGGLRNRISVLSEAYSYIPFADRIAVTRAFVLENLRAMIALESRARGIFERADRRVARPGAPRVRIHHDSTFAEPTFHDVLVTRVSRPGRGKPREASAEVEARENTPVYVRFEARKSNVYPRAWAITPTDDLVRQTLLLHGIEVETLDAPVTVEAECFWPTSLSKMRMVYQGHRMVQMRGELATSSRELPEGTLIIPARQRLARVAAVLVDPLSEDSLATWNFFDPWTRRVEGPEPEGELAFPVLRIHEPPAWETTPCELDEENIVNPHVFAETPSPDRAQIVVRVVCTQPGKRTPDSFSAAGRWRDRVTHYEIASKRYDSAQLTAALLDRDDKQAAIVIRPSPLANDAEIFAAGEAARSAGFTDVYLEVQKRE